MIRQIKRDRGIEVSNVGVLIHEQFPFGALGCRQWTLSEMKRLLRWFGNLGYDQAIFLSISIFNDEEDKYNILEHSSLFGSGIRPRTGFRPGNAYAPRDRYLGTEEGLYRAERLREMMEYCREIGMTPWLEIIATLGTPQFCEEHPELLAAAGFEFSMEAMNLCPSKPAALEHLLHQNEELLRFLEAIGGVHLVFRDGTGCTCSLCQPQTEALSRLATGYYEMITGIYPQLPVSFVSHHIHISEVPDLSAALPVGMWITESMRPQTLDVPEEEDIERVKMWQAQNRRVVAAFAVQENSTALLPTVYPNRVAKVVRLAQGLDLEGIWVGSTLNPYLFPMQFWMLPKLWNEGTSARDLVEQYFERSFGAESVAPGLQWAEAMEGALNLAQSQSQRDAGFLKIFVINFAARMLPEKCIQNGVPEQFRRDMAEAVRLARNALAAAEEFCDSMREYHALDANTIIAGTEVFMHYLEMRHAKIAVLDALHEGDAEGAVRAFAPVEEACGRMLACCKNAPNTETLAQHWRRLDLLPERLASLKRLLPELADKKRFRPVFQPLEQSEQTWHPKGERR